MASRTPNANNALNKASEIAAGRFLGKKMIRDRIADGVPGVDGVIDHPAENANVWAG
jgi:hypothetical protein